MLRNHLELQGPNFAGSNYLRGTHQKNLEWKEFWGVIHRPKDPLRDPKRDREIAPPYQGQGRADPFVTWRICH